MEQMRISHNQWLQNAALGLVVGLLIGSLPADADQVILEESGCRWQCLCGSGLC